MRDEAIHGHDTTSQQLACKRKLQLEVSFLHDNRDQVLACDADLKLSISVWMSHLHPQLDHGSASESLLSSRVLPRHKSSLFKYIKGIRNINTYYPGATNTAPRPPNNRVPRKARPKQRGSRALPTPTF
jgi:hypothetical protein